MTNKKNLRKATPLFPLTRTETTMIAAKIQRPIDWCVDAAK
jgi:hypothetical protein